METCQFSYISTKTRSHNTALGIERSWDHLKEEFNRSGPGIPGATYYKTISLQGPQLFAVVDEKQVFYHDNGHWYPYNTATDIKFGQRNTTTDDPQRATEKKPSEPVIEVFSQEEQGDLEDD
jgi:hypothetical protein